MIQIKNLSKIYNTKHGEVAALNNVSLTISKGEFIVIRGASGSGKTTLLLTLGAMLKPTSGNVLIEQQNIYSLDGNERNKFRANNLGFVFQMFHLLPYLTVLENVKLAELKNNNEEAINILNDLGLNSRLSHKPFALSAGEKQRTAVARALINNPQIILADEPTGNLDPKNAEEVIKSFKNFNNKGGTVIVVTHGNEVDDYADKIISMENGIIK